MLQAVLRTPVNFSPEFHFQLRDLRLTVAIVIPGLNAVNNKTAGGIPPADILIDAR